MKLRLQDASIRFRLSQSEIDDFAARGRVEGVTPIGPGTVFRYVVAASPDVDDVTATYEGGVLSVLVPEGTARRWTSTDAVGFEAEQNTGETTLNVLVEKDFQCLHGKAEDRDPDAFPHPLENADG